jgi:putative ABC transport system permease protein
MIDLLEEIWATVRRNKLRTALTGFAVAWGIFMLIFLLGAGNGLINATESNSGRFLDNSMSVGGGTTSKEYKGLKEGREIQLQDKDITSTQQKFSANVDSVEAQIRHAGATITYGENYLSTEIDGVAPLHARINKIEMLHGRFINDVDNSQQRKVIVLNEDQAKELNERDPAALVGQYVKMDSLAFRVVGITQSNQNGMNTSAYLPFSTLRIIYQMGDKVDNINFSFHGLQTEADNEAFEKRYKATLNANHDAAPDDEDAVWIWNRFTQAMQMNMGMGIIRKALWIIGLFTLMSGIVGVSNIMLITVKERTREFGIRKAIGATPASILRLIITESVIITTFFGYIGMLCGIAANEYMDATIGHEQVDAGLFKATMFLNPTVGFDVCIEALVVMVIAGTLAGLIPARKAARIRPIEALNNIE